MGTIELEVYVDDGCLICARAVALAAQVQEAFPGARVVVVRSERDGGEHRGLVAAVPTYVLNGRVVSLGNPAFDDLEATILEVASGRSRP